MNNIIDIKDSISDLSNYLGAILLYYDTTKIRLDDIETFLSSCAWKGDAKERCVAVCSLLKDYLFDINALAEEYKAAVDDLITDVEMFTEFSESISLIASI